MKCEDCSTKNNVSAISFKVKEPNNTYKKLVVGLCPQCIEKAKEFIRKVNPYMNIEDRNKKTNLI